LSTSFLLRRVILMLVIAAVGGCGGGGGSASSTAPVITSQPAANTVLTGAIAKFTVSALSDSSATFEWRLDNQGLTDSLLSNGPCAGATASGTRTNTLLVSNVPFGCDQTSLTVQVGNSAGLVVSQTALLTVYGYSKQVSNNGAFVNGSTVFSVDGNFPLRAVFQWQISGVTITDGAINSGVCASAIVAGSATKSLSLSNLPLACNAAEVYSKVTVDGASLLSQKASLAVSGLVAQPLATAVLVGGNASFNVTTVGGSNLQYAWALNGSPLINGAISSGVCAGTVVSGAFTPSLLLQTPPISCDGAILTVKLSSSVNSTLIGGPATLNVSGSSAQPLPVTITQGNTAQFSFPLVGTPLPTSIVWRINGSNLSDGYLATGLCAGATVSGANSALVTIVNTPTSCSGSIFSALTNGAGGAVTSSDAVLTVSVGDLKNGTYKSFATDGRTYDISVNFDANTFKIFDSTGVVSSGTLAADLSPVSSSVEAGTFRMIDPTAIISSGGGFKYKNDVLVGVHLPFGATMFKQPIPFVAARKFVRSSAEITTSTDFKVLGKDISAAEIGGYAADSNITTGRLTNAGLEVCSGGALVDVASCGTGGSALINYTLSYNSDGSVTFRNLANTADTGTAYVAKMGSELLYLRASIRSSGLPSFRLGVQSVAASSVNIMGGDSVSYWGTIAANSSSLSFNGANLVLAGPAISRTSSNRTTVIPSGLYSYGDSTNGVYYAAQSAGIFVAAGARDASFPSVNGRTAFGLIP
jgi:hypothetical protein